MMLSILISALSLTLAIPSLAAAQFQHADTCKQMLADYRAWVNKEHENLLELTFVHLSRNEGSSYGTGLIGVAELTNGKLIFKLTEHYPLDRRAVELAITFYHNENKAQLTKDNKSVFVHYECSHGLIYGFTPASSAPGVGRAMYVMSIKKKDSPR